MEVPDPSIVTPIFNMIISDPNPLSHGHKKKQRGARPASVPHRPNRGSRTSECPSFLLRLLRHGFGGRLRYFHEGKLQAAENLDQQLIVFLREVTPRLLP